MLVPFLIPLVLAHRKCASTNETLRPHVYTKLPVVTSTYLSHHPKTATARQKVSITTKVATTTTIPIITTETVPVPLPEHTKKQKEPEPTQSPKPSPEPTQQPPKPSPQPTEKPSEPKPSPKSSPSNGDTKFPGTQTGIGSFFHSNKGSDDTNGNSWCSFKYKDYSRGFAPDLKQMTDGTLAKWGHPKWEYYGKGSCGLEALVTNVDTGKTMTLYIIDAFDPAWVRTPGSIDIMADAWKELSGGAVFDKNHVLNIKWTLTGNRSDKYCFGCAGDP